MKSLYNSTKALKNWAIIRKGKGIRSRFKIVYIVQKYSHIYLSGFEVIRAGRHNYIFPTLQITVHEIIILLAVINIIFTGSHFFVKTHSIFNLIFKVKFIFFKIKGRISRRGNLKTSFFCFVFQLRIVDMSTAVRQFRSMILLSSIMSAESFACSIIYILSTCPPLFFTKTKQKLFHSPEMHALKFFNAQHFFLFFPRYDGT